MRHSPKHAVSADGREDFLEPALVFILLKYRDAILGQPLLEIGVGSGRTTLYLSRLTSEYVGIDSSDPMVSHCRVRFPDLRFDLCDARDLTRFADESFRWVVLSMNGAGATDDDGWARALAEVARVLQSGGVAVFSARNQNCRDAIAGPTRDRKWNPFALAAKVARWIQDHGAENHSRRRYCVGREEQRQQLENAGLTLVELFDSWANALGAHSDDSSSPSIWYVARKGR
jgi:ubiquinone/menaquinone biosynthesis C-methylase UbiE